MSYYILTVLHAADEAIEVAKLIQRTFVRCAASSKVGSSGFFAALGAKDRCLLLTYYADMQRRDAH